MSPPERRNPRFTASYIPWSFSMMAVTRGSSGSQFWVPSSEHESCTMCSTSTPWSATEAIHSRSHWEFRKLGVVIENFGMVEKMLVRGQMWQTDSLKSGRLSYPSLSGQRMGEPFRREAFSGLGNSAQGVCQVSQIA